ncbi:YbaN family protein [uncultured Parvimonas sp.]|uniref:YbaN family protein n=1 Tax=uncultured Parvimonas sp. TaxID=747372 RepID=UPI0025995CC0|nr:YbaN family protein [uncultured Parvimonas sp.]
MNLVKYIWIAIGLIFFAIGTVGVFLPILPTFPFYVVTVFCFARSSKKLHKWFVETNLYKNNIEKIVNRKGLPLKTKLKIIIIFTITMGTGFYFMKNTNIGRIILGVVWFCHIVYFAFGIKTIKDK